MAAARGATGCSRITCCFGGDLISIPIREILAFSSSMELRTLWIFSGEELLNQVKKMLEPRSCATVGEEVTEGVTDAMARQIISLLLSAQK